MTFKDKKEAYEELMKVSVGLCVLGGWVGEVETG